MAVAINPIYPVIAAQGAAADVALQPGTVIDARVLKILPNDLVRIAISNLAIEVMSEVPLKVGQPLQLAVSQTPDGVRLQIVPQSVSPAQSPGSSPAPATIVTTSVSGPGAAAAEPPVDSVRVARPLTSAEVVVISAALQNAAIRQNSLAPLFANLNVAASSEVLPDQVQQAALALLSARPVLDPNLGAEDLKTAFQNSGLFFEQSQKPANAALPQATPDLKGALLVLRQILSSSLGDTSQSPADAPGSTALNAAAVETVVTDDHASIQPGAFAQLGQARAQADLAAPLAPPVAPDIEMDEVFLPQAKLPVADDIDEFGILMRDVTPSASNAGRASNPADILSAMEAQMRSQMMPRVPGKASVAGSLDEVLLKFPRGVQDAVRSLLEAQPLAGARTLADSRIPGGAPAHDDAPPPPFRGAAPSAQAVASPSIDSDMSADVAMHQLADDTDAALARQTLLQIASLPNSPDQPALRAALNVPRWNFEIPFATPQGTAVAQFEISRDGGDGETAVVSASKVWRARFSLNIEPAGPVHALVSLSGDKTSVRMWAERPSTAQQLRMSKSDLTRALRDAELDPGDIVIAEGQAPSQASAPSGHFLDRAL